MKELVVLSGKCGTGKTSVLAALAVVAGDREAAEPAADAPRRGASQNAETGRPGLVLADADVDAADLHLITRPEVEQSHEFISGFEAVIDPAACWACGRCQQVCRFDAVRSLPRDKPHESGQELVYQVDPAACEGCGRCLGACQFRAISREPRMCGHWFVSRTRMGWMVHAALKPGGENSGKLVRLVRQEARRKAKLLDLPLLITDGPPGIGCPAIATLGGADLALMVCEPSPSARHDLLGVLDLAEHFGVPVVVCINRWDLNPSAADELETELGSRGVDVIGRIGYDRSFTEAQMQRLAVTELDGAAESTRALRRMWAILEERLQ